MRYHPTSSTMPSTGCAPAPRPPIVSAHRICSAASGSAGTGSKGELQQSIPRATVCRARNPEQVTAVHPLTGGNQQPVEDVHLGRMTQTGNGNRLSLFFHCFPALRVRPRAALHRSNAPHAEHHGGCHCLPAPAGLPVKHELFASTREGGGGGGVLTGPDEGVKRTSSPTSKGLLDRMMRPVNRFSRISRPARPMASPPTPRWPAPSSLRPHRRCLGPWPGAPTFAPGDQNPTDSPFACCQDTHCSTG